MFTLRVCTFGDSRIFHDVLSRSFVPANAPLDRPLREPLCWQPVSGYPLWTGDITSVRRYAQLRKARKGSVFCFFRESADQAGCSGGQELEASCRRAPGLHRTPGPLSCFRVPEHSCRSARRIWLDVWRRVFRLPSAKVLGCEIPIDQLIQHCVEIVGTPVLVIQVVSVFPHVDGQ